MPVSTTRMLNMGNSASLGDVKAYDPATEKVLLYASGYRTVKQVVCEFFGLRLFKDFNDSGELSVDVDESKDIDCLIRCGVHYHPRLAELGVTKEEFDAIISPRLLTMIANEKNHTAGSADTLGAIQPAGDTSSQDATIATTGNPAEPSVSKPRGRPKQAESVAD